jgi:beta-xylosidase
MQMTLDNRDEKFDRVWIKSFGKTGLEKQRVRDMKKRSDVDLEVGSILERSRDI